MTMEAQKLRFVRCPRCLQLLVEYPSIPVYQCGGCGTVLRAKNRLMPIAQAGSESDEHHNFPSSLKGSPQNNKLVCSGEQTNVSSVAQPHEVPADGIISSTINSTNSCETTIQETTVSLAESVTPVEHQNEETCSLTDENTQKSGVTVKEIHDKGTGANSSSNLTQELKNLDTIEDANGGKVDIFGTSEVGTLYGKTEVIQREDKLSMYEGIHVESHGALIEELERSLSFSSDDEDFSDEAENIGLSDALRHQIGSRRFMLGGKMNDASRSDPHGRLIEELEMSFSDAEEPMEQHPVVTDRGLGNEHAKNLHALGTESAHPREGSISSFYNGHLKSDLTFNQENRLMDNGNKAKEELHIDDDSTVNSLYGDEHTAVTDKDISKGFYENENVKESQSVDTESAQPCEGSISSCDGGNIKFKQSFQHDDLKADDTPESEGGCMKDDAVTNCVPGNENFLVADEDIAGRVHGNDELTADYAGEIAESHTEDDNSANCLHGNENVVVADEDIAEGVHENFVVADKDIAERAHENEHGKDQQSLEGETKNLSEGSISLFNAGDIKSEQSFQQKELTDDGSKEKEENGMEDGNTTNCCQADSKAVARFSSLPNNRIQCKLPSFNKNKEERSYRYRASQCRQGLSLDSEDFKSIQKFIELQMDGTSSSLSSGSPSQGDLVHRTSNKFNHIVRHERLKKMDELRDQLSRLSSQKGLEERYQRRGIQYQPQSNSYDVEQHLQSVDADSIPNSCALESYYGHGRPPRYQPPIPFSPTHTYTHCHFGHAQTRIPHNYDAWEFNSYYQSSYAESSILDHESLKLSYKEQKRVVKKHILRPLSGASPFTICNRCFNLVQTPSDIYISKAKTGKMQCGQCSKVLVLSFPSGYQAHAKISKDVTQRSNKPDNSIVSKNVDGASHSQECLTGYPVSVNEEYGASLTRSFSTHAGSSLATTQGGKKVSDSALHRLMGYDSASQLLRHSRVFEDGYESFESMVPVSSRVSRRKNT